MIIPCLGAVAYTYPINYEAPVHLSISLNAGEVAELTHTYTPGGQYAGYKCDYVWQYKIVSGDVTFLSRPGADFKYLTLDNVGNKVTVQVTTLMKANSTGVVQLAVTGDYPTNVYDDGSPSLYAKVIGKIYEE